MARPFSGKKSQQDKNALRQLDDANKYRFWTKEFLMRRFHKDNVANFDEFHIAQETLYFSILYRNFSNKNEPFKLYLEQIMKKRNNTIDKTEYFKIVHDIFEKGNNNYIFVHKIRSIMDTILNITEENPINQITPYTECSNFYIDEIQDQLLILKKYCQKYGLYPHQYNYSYSDKVILNIENKDTFITESIFFIRKPEVTPPVIFNYCTYNKCFFEDELPNKFYYYFRIDYDKKIDVTVKNIHHALALFSKRDGSYTSSRPTKNTEDDIQICIDLDDENYLEETAMVHIKYQIVSSMRFKKILPNNHLKSIENNYFLENMSPLEREFERLNAQTKRIACGGYKGRANDLLLACGMYIWDLKYLHGIPHTLIEAFLASDSKNINDVQQKLNSFNLKEENYNPLESIEKVKFELKRLGCDMSRTALHRYYSFFSKKVDNCLKHPLWQK